MRVIPAADLLDLWERGAGKPPFERAVDILGAAFPDQPAASISSWSLGQRDAAFISLQEVLFGERLTAVASCPSCGSRLELDFSTPRIRAPFSSGQAHNTKLIVGGAAYALEILPLTTNHLRQVSANPSRQALLQSCLGSVLRDGAPVEPKDLPEEVINQVGAKLADLDPQTDVQLALTCPDCAHAWEAPFDIIAFVWSEIEAWAQRTIQEVHLLASRYGWSERDILSMSAWRRQRYLQMVTG